MKTTERHYLFLAESVRLERRTAGFLAVDTMAEDGCDGFVVHDEFDSAAEALAFGFCHCFRDGAGQSENPGRFVGLFFLPVCNLTDL